MYDVYASLKCGMDYLTTCEDENETVDVESKVEKKPKHKYNLRFRSSTIS